MFKKLALLLIGQSLTLASTVAVLDNQVDIHHIKLRDHLWINHVEKLNNQDDDNNGFIDDIHGWSFVKNSNQVFDYNDTTVFPSEVYLYYEVRAKKTLGTITEAELDWYNKIRKDPEFVEKRKAFSKYSHGSHVTCLAVNTKQMPEELSKEDLTFIPIQYLGEPTEGAFVKPEFKALEKGSQAQKIAHIESYINKYIIWMIGKFDVASGYAKDKAQVIHASWGQGYSTTQKIVDGLFEEQFGESKKTQNQFEEIKKEISDNFIRGLLKKATTLIKENKNNLFVFSAGNKKEDTDKELHYPSSIQLPNVISVAASDQNNEKAYFSNFGKNTVSVFAPGVAVKSCVPGDRELPINGTSQAAPQVSALALKVFSLLEKYKLNQNPELVKAIILNTVDKSEALKDFSVSSGIINSQRAFIATKYLTQLSLKDAIKQAYQDLP